MTVTADGVSYHVVAERPGFELDEFVVSDDLSTVAMLWNNHGCSELPGPAVRRQHPAAAHSAARAGRR